ncbi:MAG: glycine zipper 2TM domain-containing protein [Polaromonas sp.]|nr:glycine zipper 2TM domain-containing protein [Polaromonas sp.]
MDTNNQVSPGSTTPPSQPGFGQQLQHSKALVAIVAVLGVTVLALAAALVVNTSGAKTGSPEQVAAAEQTSQAAKLAADTSKKPVTTTAKATTSHTGAAPVVAQSSRANVCAACGTVEAVTPVQRQGKVNGVDVGNTTVGLGTVAGGVVGGLLGNQMGGGNGKTAMTVLGVAGGAFAGNQIEKNMKKVTVYEIRVRMDDGSVRNMELSSSVPVGSKVIVEGQNLRLA